MEPPFVIISLYPMDLLPPAPALLPMSLPPPLLPLPRSMVPKSNLISFDVERPIDLLPVNLSHRGSAPFLSHGPWVSRLRSQVSS